MERRSHLARLLAARSDRHGWQWALLLLCGAVKTLRLARTLQRWFAVRASFDLDRDMAEMRKAREATLIGRRRQRMVRDQRNDGGAVSRPNLPQVEIRDPVAAGF